MERLCDFIGLTTADMAEIYGLICGTIMFGVFMGNIFSMVAKMSLDLAERLAGLLFNWIREHILEKRCKKDKDNR